MQPAQNISTAKDGVALGSEVVYAWLCVRMSHLYFIKAKPGLTPIAKLQQMVSSV